MSLNNAARSQITRYGFKGACSLIPVTSTENRAQLSNIETEGTPIQLMSYVGNYPTRRIDGKTIFATDRRVLAVPDNDWDGTITAQYKVRIDNLTYSVINFNIVRVNQTIAYVEIQCRG